MKHFVLAILFFLCPTVCVFAQNLTARDIVEKALHAHTAGQPLKTYIMRLEYDTLGRIPSQLHQQDPMKSLIDSIMSMQTDSMKEVMKQQMVIGEAGFFTSMEEIHRGERRVMISDKSRSQGVLITIRSNRLRGTFDSTRNLYSGWNGITFRENPVDVIHFMHRDSSELHYTGKAQVGGHDCYLIQVKLGSKWLDAYIDQKSYLLLRISEEQVDDDPLVGRGPARFKYIIDYQGYRLVKGFRLPVSIEEMTTRFDFTTKWKMAWENMNTPLRDELFKPQVSDRARRKFRTKEISSGVWILEQLGENENSRFLVAKGLNRLTVIGNISNSNEFNQSVLDELERQFPGYEIDGLFNVENQFGVLSLAGFFAKKAHLYAPKGMGFFAEEKGFINRVEDSTWTALRSQRLITTFETDLMTDDVSAFILNPKLENEVSQHYVCYYLPKERVIYYYGNPYSAQSDSKNARPREKKLYELIKSRNLKVEKIVYSAAYTDNAPLVMPLDEFERRIENTDFKIYEKRKY